MPNLALETALRRDGFSRIVGIDEAGRGPLAGPVSVAAVILPPRFRHPAINDSKKLSAKAREDIYEELTVDPRISWHCVFVDAETIDQLNILRATWKGMAEAFSGLPEVGDFALIDGNPVPNFPGPCQAVVKGDQKSLSIAAASIIAKVKRDRLMNAWAQHYPEYGFDQHKGYGTSGHLEALRRHGPCEIHRRSFAPVAAALQR